MKKLFTAFVLAISLGTPAEAETTNADINNSQNVQRVVVHDDDSNGMQVTPQAKTTFSIANPVGILIMSGLLAYIGFVMLQAFRPRGALAKHNIRRNRHAPTLDAALDVMCAVAALGNDAQRPNIMPIAVTFRLLTGKVISASLVREKLGHMPAQLDLAKLATEFDANERALLLLFALALASADQQIGHAEYSFACRMAHAFDIPAEEFRAAIRFVASNLTPVAQADQEPSGMLQPA